jgi:hypothetical protein
MRVAGRCYFLPYALFELGARMPTPGTVNGCDSVLLRMCHRSTVSHQTAARLGGGALLQQWREFGWLTSLIVSKRVSRVDVLAAIWAVEQGRMRMSDLDHGGCRVICFLCRGPLRTRSFPMCPHSVLQTTVWPAMLDFAAKFSPDMTGLFQPRAALT